MPFAGIALNISWAVGNGSGGLAAGAGALVAPGFGDAARLPPGGVSVGGDLKPGADTLSLMRFEALLPSDIAPPSL
jgi:hypothetical protein